MIMMMELRERRPAPLRTTSLAPADGSEIREVPNRLVGRLPTSRMDCPVWRQPEMKTLLDFDEWPSSSRPLSEVAWCPFPGQLESGRGLEPASRPASGLRAAGELAHGWRFA
jgi:hypothetical protein